MVQTLFLVMGLYEIGFCKSKKIRPMPSPKVALIEWPRRPFPRVERIQGGLFLMSIRKPLTLNRMGDPFFKHDITEMMPFFNKYSAAILAWEGLLSPAF